MSERDEAECRMAYDAGFNFREPEGHPMSAAKKLEPVEWLTTGEAAALLCGCTPETVRAYIERGHLPATKPPGGQYRIARSDVDALLARWKVKG